jgi:hypothetical protein
MTCFEAHVENRVLKEVEIIRKGVMEELTEKLDEYLDERVTDAITEARFCVRHRPDIRLHGVLHDEPGRSDL